MQTNPEDSFQIDLSQCKNDWDTRTKIKRGLWQFLVKPIYMLIPFHGLRGLRIAILRLFGARIGNRCNIQRAADILMPWNLKLGDYVTLAHHTKILNFAEVTIHSMTVISQGAHLCTGSHDYTDPTFKLVSKPIEIHAEVWVASGAFIGPGVTLGRGCVIGANSVATKSQPAWSVCAGNPCKKIKDRTVKTSE